MSDPNGAPWRAWYLAGPMTGIPQFNFPLFFRATKNLRYIGYNIVSPAELDDEEDKGAAMASPDGAMGSGSTVKKTWGDFLSRDVKLIADTVGGIIFLPNWEQSRGARLEAFVGILCRHLFAQYWEDGDECGLKTLSSQQVLSEIYNASR